MKDTEDRVSKQYIVAFVIGHMRARGLQFDGPRSAAGLTLQQGGTVLTLEMGIGSAALMAFDECVDIIHQALLQSLGRDSPLETSAWAFSIARSSQFILHVLEYVIIIALHL